MYCSVQQRCTSITNLTCVIVCRRDTHLSEKYLCMSTSTSRNPHAKYFETVASVLFVLFCPDQSVTFLHGCWMVKGLIDAVNLFVVLTHTHPGWDAPRVVAYVSAALWDVKVWCKQPCFSSVQDTDLCIIQTFILQYMSSGLSAVSAACFNFLLLCQ